LPMRMMALDHGTRRIGVAVSDEMKMIATPLEYIPAEPFDKVISTFKLYVDGRLVASKDVPYRVSSRPTDTGR